MSREIALRALNLDAPERPAHTEYVGHRELLSHITGVPQDHPECGARFTKAWDIDFTWNTPHGPVSWKDVGRVTDMGHSEYVAGGSDRRNAQPSPFRSVEDVLAFNAVEEYGLPDLDELTRWCRECHRARSEGDPNVLVPGGYYRTLVSGAIDAFGWDLLLEAAAHQDAFDRVMGTFFELSLRHYTAWSRTDIQVFICHDDMVWSQGAFMHPDFYRRAIFPRYKTLWSVLKEAGKKVLFCSDGQWFEFADDIAAAGADGFIFEPMVPFDRMVERFGKTHVIIGSSVDCRTLTFGSREKIKAEIDASLALGMGCPGWFAAVGNHIASNVPIENALFYYNYLSANWKR